jgi:hypothetical protein
MDLPQEIQVTLASSIDLNLRRMPRVEVDKPPSRNPGEGSVHPYCAYQEVATSRYV